MPSNNSGLARLFPWSPRAALMTRAAELGPGRRESLAPVCPAPHGRESASQCSNSFIRSFNQSSERARWPSNIPARELKSGPLASASGNHSKLSSDSGLLAVCPPNCSFDLGPGATVAVGSIDFKGNTNANEGRKCILASNDSPAAQCNQCALSTRSLNSNSITTTRTSWHLIKWSPREPASEQQSNVAKELN